MVVDFSHRRSRWSFLFLIILAAGEFSFLASKVWVAEQWNESSDPKNWLAAAQLEPGNAQYWEQLGLYNEMNLEQRDQSKAANYLRRATQIDPLSVRPWLELAALDEERGDFPAAKRALLTLRHASPPNCVVGRCALFGHSAARQRVCRPV